MYDTFYFNNHKNIFIKLYLLTEYSLYKFLSYNKSVNIEFILTLLESNIK